MGDCPVCSAGVKLAADTVKGELVQCGDCGADLEVSGLTPVLLAEAPEEGEDWGE